jgi:hypothetical protein
MNHDFDNLKRYVTTKPKKTVKNIAKGASFTYAFRKINESLKSGYYLEAVTLAESIISDRLLSFVKQHHKNETVKTPFHKLIRSAKKLNHIDFSKKDGTDLFDALDKWRDKRNICIHAVAKSEPGEPTSPVDVFEQIAEECAKEGKLLARLICEWDKKVRQH